MTALLALWRLARPFLPYIGGALAILAVVFWIDHRGYQRGKAEIVAKYQPKLDRALKAELAGIASIRKLRAAIDLQNAGKIALAKAEADKLAEAQRALAAARAHDRARETQIAALKLSAARAIPGAPCEASQATKEAWK